MEFNRIFVMFFQMILHFIFPIRQHSIDDRRFVCWFLRSEIRFSFAQIFSLFLV